MLLVLSSHQRTLPEYLEALERFQPDLLHAYPSAALQLAEFLEKTGQAGEFRCVGCSAGRSG